MESDERKRKLPRIGNSELELVVSQINDEETLVTDPQDSRALRRLGTTKLNQCKRKLGRRSVESLLHISRSQKRVARERKREHEGIPFC